MKKDEHTPHIQDGTCPFGATLNDWCGSTGARNVAFRVMASNATASTKLLRDPDYCYDDVGFRVARL